MICVDGIVMCATAFDDLHPLDAVLRWLECVGLHAAVHICMLYDTSIQWLGKVYRCCKIVSGEGSPDEVEAGMAIEGMIHEPMEFLNGMFCGS